MAAAYVKEVLHASPTLQVTGTTTVLAVTAAPGNGSLLLLAVACGGAFTVNSVADSQGNTWTKDKSQTQSNNICVFSTVQNIGPLSTSDTITLTFSGSLSNTHVAATVDEFSGCTKTIDVSNTGTQSVASTTRSAGSLTTLNANDLLFDAYCITATETSFTPTAGFSTPTVAFYGTSISVERQYQIVAATGTYGGDATGVSAVSAGVSLAYQAAAAGGGGQAPQRRIDISAEISI